MFGVRRTSTLLVMMSAAVMITFSQCEKLLASMERIIHLPNGDNQTWTHPSEYAKKCLNDEGKNLVAACQQHSTDDFGPDRINTTKSTTWETCCALYEELDCYLANAKIFCPDNLRKSLIDYTRKVVIFFQQSLCHTVIQVGWQQWCDNKTHDEMVKHNRNRTDPTPLINLPTPKKIVQPCFDKMRHSTLSNGTVVDISHRCIDRSIAKWDPKREKLYDSDLHDSCCAYYDALDCIEVESRTTCTADEQRNVADYRSESINTISGTICKMIPGDKAGELCKTSAAIGLNTIVSPLFMIVLVTICALIF